MGQAARASDTARAVLDMPDLPGEIRDRAELALLQAEAGLQNGGACSTGRKRIVKAGDEPGRGLVTGALIVLAVNAWDEGDLIGALEFARTGVRQTFNDGGHECRLHPGLILASFLVDLRLMDEARRTMLLGADGIGRGGWAAGRGDPAIAHRPRGGAAGGGHPRGEGGSGGGRRGRGAPAGRLRPVRAVPRGAALRRSRDGHRARPRRRGRGRDRRPLRST